MTIVFKGVVEKQRKGCGACGRARSEYQSKSIKTYTLLSGVTKTFRVGAPVEVLDTDGAELLSYKYLLPNGKEEAMFEEV